MSKFISGSSRKMRSDCRVSYEPTSNGGMKIVLRSKVDVFYGNSIREQAQNALKDLQIDNCKLEIDDYGALPFVIQARIEAAVKMAHPQLQLQSLPPMREHCAYASSWRRLRRTRLYLPGNQPKLMLNAGIHQPDGIILDLEDAVAPVEKFSARLIVRNALRSLNFFGAERMVRINQGPLGMEDLAAVVAHNVHVLLIPKVEKAAQVVSIDDQVQKVCKKCGRTDPVFLMPILESALGMHNAFAIAAASPNNVALAIGLEDYTADIGTQRTNEGRESFWARSIVVNAARAAGIQPIDTVFSDVVDSKGLALATREAKSLGFEGKGCIHPRQIRIVHEALAPEGKELEKAKRIVRAFEDAQAKGLGVVSLGSKMIDPPVVKRAQATVRLAVTMGLLAENWQN